MRPVADLAAADTLAASQHITIERLDDEALEAIGAPVTSRYCEVFWLPVIGPSALWLLRHAVMHTVDGPYTVDVDTLARSLGLGAARGIHSPLVRTLNRLVQFRCATGGWQTATWKMRTHLPALTDHRLARLPDVLRQAHDELLAGASL